MRRNSKINEALQRSQQILYYLVLEGIFFLGKRENIYTIMCLSSLDTECNPSHPCVQEKKKKKEGKRDGEEWNNFHA